MSREILTPANPAHVLSFEQNYIVHLLERRLKSVDFIRRLRPLGQADYADDVEAQADYITSSS